MRQKSPKDKEADIIIRIQEIKVMRKLNVSFCLFAVVAFICLSCNAAKSGLVSADQAPQKRGNVAILIFKGVQIIDYTGPYEVFGGSRFNVYTVAEKAEPITTAMGMTVVPKYSFADSPTPDVLVLPGGGGYLPGHGGVGDQLGNPAVIKWIQDNAKEAKYVLTVCNGAFFAAKAGLLDGLEATTYYGMIDALKTVAPKTKVVSDKRYVDNGKIITTAGLSSGIDGSLYLVSKMFGKGTAQAVALNMEYNWNPESKYARAALADKYLRFAYDGIEADSLSREGGTDYWENKWLVKSESAATAIMEIINKTLAENKTYAPTTIKWVRQDSGKAADASKSLWKFTDENGKTWTGVASLEPVAGEKNKFTMSVKIARSDVAARLQNQ
jgi:putative intracellular protease/amidase